MGQLSRRRQRCVPHSNLFRFSPHAHALTPFFGVAYAERHSIIIVITLACHPFFLMFRFSISISICFNFFQPLVLWLGSPILIYILICSSFLIFSSFLVTIFPLAFWFYCS